MIRIVGLSATLPNYMDVAKFLRVNPFLGLFFFDARFRPVPLGMTFVGVKTLNRIQRLADMNEVSNALIDYLSIWDMIIFQQDKSTKYNIWLS